MEVIEQGVKILAGCFCIWLILSFIYNVFFHPLARVPGPFVARFSRFWLVYNMARGRFHEVNQALHKQYGSVVRVAPNEVSVVSPEALKTVHGQNTEFTKGDWYNVAQVWHDPDALQTLVEFDDKKRRFQRRLFGPAYTTAALSQHEENVDRLLVVLVNKLKEEPYKVHDLDAFFHIFGCDALGEMLLSERPHYVENGSDHGTSYHDWRKWWVRTVVGQSSFAMSLFRFLRRRTRLGNFLEMDHYTVWLFSAIRRRMGATEPEKSPYGESESDVARDLVLLQHKKTGWKPQWTGQMLIASGIAGNSTIVATSLAVFACLNEQPDVLARVVEELESARAAGRLSSPPRYTELADLPYFEACIKEAMRVYPAAFIGLQRRVPAGGATIDGYAIPAGATVDMNMYLVHRNKDVYGADAEEFNPDRWLGKDEERRRVMQQNFMGFGGRSRPCPGQYLAEMIIFKLYASLFLDFDVRIGWDRSRKPTASIITFLPGLTASFQPKHRSG
jgi:cytochrome P450